MRGRALPGAPGEQVIVGPGGQILMPPGAQFGRGGPDRDDSGGTGQYL
jgi:hypothetical protein